MQKIIFIYFLFCLIQSENSFGAFVRTADDTSRYHVKGYKLSQQEFLDKYGIDDSSRALIRYYFQKRKLAVGAAIVSSVVALASGIAFELIVMGSSSGTALGSLFIGVSLLSLLFVGTIVTLTGFFVLLTHSRRRLFRKLLAYQRGKGIPPAIRRKKLFNNFLKANKKGIKLMF